MFWLEALLTDVNPSQVDEILEGVAFNHLDSIAQQIKLNKLEHFLEILFFKSSAPRC